MVNDKSLKDGAAGSGKVTNSPYYLGSNDNPGNIITQVQLRGPNYEEWARAMKASLRSMLVSWIMNIIEPSLRTTISYVEEASALWKDIKERFSVANGPRIQQLKSELAGYRQEGLSIVSYYGKLKVIWDELINYEQFPLCKCGKCTTTKTGYFPTVTSGEIPWGKGLLIHSISHELVDAPRG
ncbi:retrovirus-related pol polyprotein from transposon TNT 1-94 [Tanacetum coccineum]